MSSSRTVLVTGADGFTGRYLTEALQARGDRVIAVSGPGDALGANASHGCDLTDPDAVNALIQAAAPTHVVHLAARSFVAHADAAAFYQVNVLGTTHLLQALSSLNTPPEKVLLASSANIYGEPAVERIAESLCPAPVNHYACSKLAMEHMARTFASRLPLVIVRPFNYTGPGQHERFLIPKIVNHFRRRAPLIELGNLDVQRDFSDVRDIISAYLALLDAEAGTPLTCNLCSGRPTALKDVIQIMERLAGYRIQVRVNPAFVRQNEIRTLVGDPTHMHRHTGVQVRPFAQTLEDMLSAPPTA